MTIQLDIFFASLVNVERYYRRGEKLTDHTSVIYHHDRHYASIRNIRQLLPDPKSDLRVNLSDGFEDSDDVFTFEFVGVPKDLHWESRGREHKAEIILVGVNGVLFGPYDIESVSHNVFEGTTEIMGRKDRWLDSSVSFSVPELMAGVNSIIHSGVEPYFTWINLLLDTGYTSEIITSIVVAGAAQGGLDSARGALSEWGLTFIPAIYDLKHDDLSNGERGISFIRRPKIETIYPTIREQVQLRRYQSNRQTLQLLPDSFHTRLKTVSEDDYIDSLGFDQPDIYNGRGDYLTRRIDIAVDSMVIPYAERLIFTYGTDLTKPPVILDNSALSGEFGLIASDQKRWELQNNSITSSFVLEGDPTLGAGSYIQQKESNLIWRVVGVNHAIGDSGFLTTVSVVLYQGSPVVVRTTPTIPPTARDTDIPTPPPLDADVVIDGDETMRSGDGSLRVSNGDHIGALVRFTQPVSDYSIASFRIRNIGESNVISPSLPSVSVIPGETESAPADIQVLGDISPEGSGFVIEADAHNRANEVKVLRSPLLRIHPDQNYKLNTYVSSDFDRTRVFIQAIQTGGQSLQENTEFVFDKDRSGGDIDLDSITILGTTRQSQYIATMDSIVFRSRGVQGGLSIPIYYTIMRNGISRGTFVQRIELDVNHRLDSFFSMEISPRSASENFGQAPGRLVKIHAREKQYGGRDFLIGGRYTYARDEFINLSSGANSTYAAVQFPEGGTVSLPIRLPTAPDGVYTGEYLVGFVVFSTGRFTQGAGGNQDHVEEACTPGNVFRRRKVEGFFGGLFSSVWSETVGFGIVEDTTAPP